MACSTVQRAAACFLFLNVAAATTAAGSDSGSNSSGSAGSSAAGGGHHGEHATFEELLAMAIFFAAIWAVGKGASALGSPNLVGEIICGIILGPNLLDFVPYHVCLMLLGEIGLLLLVVDAGTHVHLETLKEIGLRGAAIATVGSFAPLLVGLAIALGFGYEFKPSLAAGMTLGPTSMGIALEVLKKANVLSTLTGQLIITSAVIDDVYALVMLSILQALENPTADGFLKPILSSAGWVFLVGGFALFGVPKIWAALLPRLPTNEGLRGQILFGLMLAIAVGFTAAAHYSFSSFLLGAFIGGLCFCGDEVHHEIGPVWNAQVKRVGSWLLRIFFAGSVGFTVPIKSFFTGKVIGLGFLFLIALLGKMFTGLMAGSKEWKTILTVGFSMAAWGEFAFIIATTAAADGIIDTSTKDGETLFSALLLAVLLSTIIAPVSLRVVVNWDSGDGEDAEEGGAEAPDDEVLESEGGADGDAPDAYITGQSGLRAPPAGAASPTGGARALQRALPGFGSFTMPQVQSLRRPVKRSQPAPEDGASPQAQSGLRNAQSGLKQQLQEPPVKTNPYGWTKTLKKRKVGKSTASAEAPADTQLGHMHDIDKKNNATTDIIDRCLDGPKAPQEEANAP